MERLVKLIHGLSPSEVQFVKSLFKSELKNKSKRSTLFDLISEGRIKSNSDAFRLIYHEESNAHSALSHLKKKLFDEIVDILSAIFAGTESNELNLKKIECKRNLIKSELLLERGLTKEGVDMLRTTLQDAQKFDYPDISLSVLDILLNRDINLEEHCFHLDAQILLHNYSELLQSKVNFYYGKEKSRKVFREDRPQNSKRVYFWHELSSIKENLAAYRFEKARRSALGLMDFLHLEPEINSLQMTALVCSNLTEIYLKLRQFEEARRYAEITHANLSPLVPLYQESLMVVFFAFLRNSCYNEAEKIYKQATADTGMDVNFLNKWILLRGALDFYRKNYKSVCGTISKCNLKMIHDPGWSFSPRFLELLSILEMGDYEWYEFRLDCYRKKLGKFRMEVTDRIKLIFGLLQSLVKVNFNYDQLVKKETKVFEALSNSTSKLCWNPVGHELINIPQWLFSKSQQFNFQSGIKG